MEAVHLPIAQDVTAPLILEKKVVVAAVVAAGVVVVVEAVVVVVIGIGIERGRESERESGNIDTKTDIAHAPTLTDTKERGEAFIHH